MPLTRAQMQRTLQPVRADRVEHRQGLTYVPAHEVRAELTRVFGPAGWDSQAHDVHLLYEEQRRGADGRDRWVACYRVAVTLRVRDYDGHEVASFTEYHAEENAPQPNRGEAHALALTSCESYALRRAAIGLGDAFGLHLYAQGSLAPLVVGTLALTDPDSPLVTPVAATNEALGTPEVAISQPDPVEGDDETDDQARAAS